MAKPAPVAKKRVYAAIGLLGVLGDSGRRKSIQEPERPVFVSATGLSPTTLWRNT
jgi:hypothetical protein